MSKVPATEFKAKCLELMDRVAERRETFVITKRGRAVAKLVPVETGKKDSIFGWLRGRGEVMGDITAPAVSPAAWETLAEWDALNPAVRPGGRRGRGGAAKRKRR